MSLVWAWPPAAVLADSVKLGGFWIDDVTVREIVYGKIVYATATGSERVQPLAKLQGLKLTAFPDSVPGQAALDAKDYEQVLARFAEIARQARRPWVRHWALSHEIAALDQLGRPTEAVEAYLQLVREQADPHFLATPPLDSLRQATDQKKKDLAENLKRVRKKLAKGSAREPFAKMIAMLEPGQPDDAVTDQDAPGPEVPALPVAAALAESDPITKLLQARQFDQALAETARRLRGKEPHLSMRLYQQGLAQLYLAQQSDDRRLYLDAGLSFMRVAICFRKSIYTGPALLEAGVVHEKIGRHELALKLWRKAQLEIDPEADPVLAQRLAAMLAGEAEN